MDQVAFIWQLDYDMCAIVTIVLNFQQMMYRQANVIFMWINRYKTSDLEKNVHNGKISFSW